MPQSEIATITHKGREFSAGGASHDGRGNFTAYEHADKPGTLTTAGGRIFLEFAPDRVLTAEIYNPVDWDGESFARVYILPKSRGYLVAYSLGPGCLVRGEYHDVYLDDAKLLAKEVARIWIERDADDQAQFDYEQEQGEKDCERADAIIDEAFTDCGHLAPELIFGDWATGEDSGGESVLAPADCANLYDWEVEPEIASGWCARLSASGFLDCTDWCGPFDTKTEAAQELADMFEEEG